MKLTEKEVINTAWPQFHSELHHSQFVVVVGVSIWHKIAAFVVDFMNVPSISPPVVAFVMVQNFSLTLRVIGILEPLSYLQVVTFHVPQL